MHWTLASPWNSRIRKSLGSGLGAVVLFAGVVDSSPVCAAGPGGWFRGGRPGHDAADGQCRGKQERLGRRHLDVTRRIESLGIPYERFYPDDPLARNIWDMFAYGDRVYLSAGNLDTEDSATTQIIYWDPAASAFVEEYATSEESLFNYERCAGTLCAAGLDSGLSRSQGGRIYLRQGSGWEARVLPRATKINAFGEFGGELFAGIQQINPSCDLSDTSPTCYRTAILRSRDFGSTWEEIFATGDLGDTTEFLPFGRKFYVNFTGGDATFSPWYQYDGDTFVNRGANFLPGAEVGLSILPTIQPESFVETGGKLVYLGAYIYGFDPYSLWVAESEQRVRRIRLPADARPRDLALIERGPLDQVLLVMTATRQGNGNYRISVFETRDLLHWVELFRFSSETFARSFAYLEGDFYFSLGGYGSESIIGEPYLDGGGYSSVGVHPLVGSVLRLRASRVPRARDRGCWD